MPRRFRTADITVRVPFGSTDPVRIALLHAAGVPLNSSGDAAWGFLHERRPCKFGDDSIWRWFDTGSASPLPAMQQADGAPAAAQQQAWR
ncbi:hypothetical protein [Variovorax sp. SG533]|uniref:hypothetical protein n=1 Tax=Variovorax sp. DAIF25 TaxID=3080983 RepID=UPI00159D8473